MKNLHFSASCTKSLGIFSVLFMVFSLLLPSTADASYHFDRAVTCKAVENGYPVHETSKFEKHETPHAWFKLTNVYGYVKGEFIWIHPNGQHTIKKTSHEVYSNGGSIRFHTAPNIKGHYGKWQVQYHVYHNGKSVYHAIKSIDYGVCACTKEYKPVCGSDGKTYDNACLATCAGVSYTYGECKPACVCTREYNPVCGSDGKTYNNPCLANCAGVSYTYGECKPACVCSKEYKPVCGSDGKTYDNACLANCAGVSYTYGECKPACICSREFNPVCGSDGKTYDNPCLADCAGVSYTYGECHEDNAACDYLNLIDLVPDLCKNCFNEVAIYRYNNKNYVVFDGRKAGSHCVTSVINCKTSTTLCETRGNSGHQKCSTINFFSKAVKKKVVLSEDCNKKVTCACTKPGNDNYCEDFDSYDTHKKLGPQSKCWTTWDGQEGGHKDGIIKKDPHSKNQYLYIKGDNPNGGYQDVVLKMNNRTSGYYELEFDIYIPHGRKAYYNTMHKLNFNDASKNQWASQVYFNDNGSGYLKIKGNNYPFYYSYGKWIKVYQYFDLDNDQTELRIDGKRVHRWKFSHQSTKTEPGVKKLRAIAFYPASTYYEYYVDNVKLKKTSHLTDDAAAESRSGNPEEDVTKVHTFVEPLASSLTVFPNPFQGSVNIQIPEGAEEGDLTIFDQFGRLVRQLPAIESQAAQTITMDVSDLVSGIYYVRLNANGQIFTEKIIKQ